MTRENVKLDEITVDPALNVRSQIDPETVARYADILETLPPVILYRLADDTLLLAGGFHRLEAARQRGWDQIAAQVRSGSRAEAQIAAVVDNCRHGKPYSRAERRRAIERLLTTAPERANNWLATELGVSSNTVAVVRAELEAAGQIPCLARLVGADGKERPRTFSTAEEDEAETEEPEVEEADPAAELVTEETAIEKSLERASPQPAPQREQPAAGSQTRPVKLEVAGLGEALATEVTLFIDGQACPIPVTLLVAEGRIGGLLETTPEHCHALLLGRSLAERFGLLWEL